MTRVLEHRGPDDEGFFVDTAVALGARRLSIIDLEGGHQPMPNEDESIWVVFNGEIYNFEALRRELITAGHRFASRSDTEVLVHGYELWGEALFPRLNGMFAVAVWDARSRTLVLACDKIGIKPLYYTRVGSGLAFASEMKALLILPDVPRALDLAAIDEYLSRRFPMRNHTPFLGIRRLGPGRLLRAKQGSIDIVRYWQLTATHEPHPIPAAAVRRALEDSVRRQLVADVPVGISLSGGIDSSSLAALAAGASSQPISTFTAGFGEETDETRAAREVADHLGANHHEIMLSTEEMTRGVVAQVWFMDEPVADPAIMPTFNIMRFARKYVKVALLGEGADELFGGYSHYRLGAPPFSYLPLKVRKRVYHRVNLLIPMEERRSVCSFEGAGQSDLDFLDSSFDSLPFAEGMMRAELRRVLPRFQLQRVDRMSMAHSLEARVPYLDDVVVDTAMTVPVRDKIGAFQTKKILRRAVKDLLPSDIVWRKKRIFRVPIRPWLTETFGEAMESQLDSSDLLHRLFREEPTRKLLHRSTWVHNDRAAYKAWMLSVLDLWYRTFVERDASELRGPIKPPW
jgi:asparagine synthase (glutamine-hydrolysing)